MLLFAVDIYSASCIHLRNEEDVFAFKIDGIGKRLVRGRFHGDGFIDGKAFSFLALGTDLLWINEIYPRQNWNPFSEEK